MKFNEVSTREEGKRSNLTPPHYWSLFLINFVDPIYQLFLESGIYLTVNWTELVILELENG